MRLLVIDGNSLINRAFYGVKPLTTKDGLYTNALYGFWNMLQRLREQVQPDHIAAAFDMAAPTFRHRQYDAYKAGRKGMPPELAQQLPILKELLALLGITVVEKAGYEADDILGTLAQAVRQQGGDCFVATGDRDSLQLVGDGITVLLATTKMGRPETVTFDTAAVEEKYGLSPAQLIDLKALMGDASDNIPGVPGVGEKTALELLHMAPSLDELYAQLDTLTLRDSVRQKLIGGRDSAYLSRELGMICRTAPVDTAMDAYAVREVQREPLARLLTRLEFFSVLEKLGLNAAASSPTPAEAEAEVAPLTRVVTGPEALAGVLEGAQTNGRLDVFYAAQMPETAWYVTAPASPLAVVPQAEAQSLTEALCRPLPAKRTHDSKPLFAVLLQEGKRPEGFAMDTLLAAYLLNPLASAYDLPRLAQEYGIAPPTIDTADEAAQTAALLPPVAERLAAELEKNAQTALLRDMELPLALVLADMENIGFEVDGAGIAAFGGLLQERIHAIQSGIYEAVGHSFNLNSPKQLATALFEELGLPAKKKTKSGYSTNAEVLEGLRSVHPAVEMLLDYRMLAKLKSTYCDGLLKVIAPDGRIHSSFNQTETRTGRISSTEPNLQNIPVRQELGRELRRFFRARDGWVLCDADYSQIELRVLAHMADEPTMLEAFNNGLDIHRITASQVFDVPEELVTPLLRSRAKAVNFGIVYGIGAHSLSQDIGVSYGEAKRYIDEYLKHYGAVAGFMEQLIAAAKETGYAQTLFGRRRPLPELNAGNAVTRSFGERVARNMPIQGTAADIIKLAMIRVYDRLREEGLRARLILQVHDELLVEAPEAEAERAAAILKEEMEHAAALKVKLAVDVHIGKTWYEAKA